MKGILYFYQTAVARLTEQVAHYLAPAAAQIRKTSCVESVEGPIMSVLRKSYQLNYKQMMAKALQRELLQRTADEI